MAGDKICCASYVENGENMMEKDESNVNSESEDEAAKDNNPCNHRCPEFEFSVIYLLALCFYLLNYSKIHNVFANLVFTIVY